MEILKKVLNSKIDFDSKSGEGEIEDEESDCENHDTSEWDGYNKPQIELNLQTDCETSTGKERYKKDINRKPKD